VPSECLSQSSGRESSRSECLHPEPGPAALCFFTGNCWIRDLRGWKGGWAVPQAPTAPVVLDAEGGGPYPLQKDCYELERWWLACCCQWVAADRSHCGCGCTILDFSRPS